MFAFVRHSGRALLYLSYAPLLRICALVFMQPTYNENFHCSGSYFFFFFSNVAPPEPFWPILNCNELRRVVTH
jgi:hypothetical protein